MLLYLREDLNPSQREGIAAAAERAGFHVSPLGPEMLTLFGDGDAAGLESLDGVLRLADAPNKPVLVERGEKSGTTPIAVGSKTIGGGDFTVIAGPCSVEDRGLILDLALAAKDAGVDMLRGGAFKPRTSPYTFRGLGRKGLEYLREAGDASGLPVVTEVMDTRDMPLVAEFADMLQIGARNMLNYSLLSEAGRAGVPVFLKRGMGATLDEFYFAAEYVLVEGSPGVAFCERGIRTLNTTLRNTLDLACVPLIREQSHLPVIVDPSHATGRSELVPAMALAAAAAGAHGVMIEVHDQPEKALSDGRQALSPDSLPALVEKLRRIAAIAAEEDQ